MRAGGRRSAPSARLCSAAPPRPPEARRPGAGKGRHLPPVRRPAPAPGRRLRRREPEGAPAPLSAAARALPRVPRGPAAPSPRGSRRGRRTPSGTQRRGLGSERRTAGAGAAPRSDREGSRPWRRSPVNEEAGSVSCSGLGVPAATQNVTKGRISTGVIALDFHRVPGYPQQWWKVRRERT